MHSVHTDSYVNPGSALLTSPFSMQKRRASKRTEPRTRDETKQETRQRLIEAAASLFREQGLDSPSLDAICERAGYTRGAFYVHFRDREDIILAVSELNTQRRIESIIARSDEALDLELTIRMFAKLFEGGGYGDIGAVRLHQFLAALGRSDVLRKRHVELLHESMRRISDAARRGQGAGTVRRDLDADTIGQLLLVLVGGVEVLFEMGVRVDVKKGAEAVLEMLRPHVRKR